MNIHMAKKWTEMVVKRSFIKEHSFRIGVYVLLCSKMTSFPPSEGEFSEKLSIFSKVKNFQNPSCYILEKLDKNHDER